MIRRVAGLGGFFGKTTGFTLVESVVVTGIITVALSMVGGGIFQVLSIQRTWRDDVVATKELRHAGSWFAGDALNATATDLVPDDPPVGSVTLQWTDGAGVPRTVTYSLSGVFLERASGGDVIAVARRVTSVGFSLAGQTLTFDLTVEAETGGTESASLQTYLRMLQP